MLIMNHVSNSKIIKGSYLLLIQLEKKTSLPKKFNFQIKPGLYAYAGNAYGPGGIQARCKRHFKFKKKKYWHIDWLTTQTKEIKCLSFPNENECKIIKEILKIDKTSIPCEGFGNTDCKICKSHLIKLPDLFSEDLIKISYSYFNNF
jgi:Uri superfamily endonuclease